MVILLFGPPGCGKGTQAAFMSKTFGLPAISTGEIFRAEVKAGTDLGKAASEIMQHGGLVPDEMVNRIVVNRLAQPDCRGGFMLDGYPRTVVQAEFLSKFFQESHFPEPIIIHLDVPLESLVARLTARRHCQECGHIYNLLHQPPVHDGICDFDGTALIRRKDDHEDVIRKRIQEYENLTGPLIRYYSGKNCHRLDGSQRPEEITRQIEAILEPEVLHEIHAQSGVRHPRDVAHARSER